MAVVPKQERLLVSGSVSVTHVEPGHVTATVSGDHDEYEVRWSEHEGWSCSCIAARWRASCSHVDAVRRVVRLTTMEGPT